MQSFALGDARLAPGGRLHEATLTNARYLLSRGCDRLLYSFRVYAGIDNRGAAAYGGWEAPTWGFRGHFVGHYLSACVKTAATPR